MEKKFQVITVRLDIRHLSAMELHKWVPHNHSTGNLKLQMEQMAFGYGG